jgi:ribosomal protein L13E
VVEGITAWPWQQKEANLKHGVRIQELQQDVSNIGDISLAASIIGDCTMTTWHKRDWKQFYELARRPWQRHRPPRPIYPTGINRVLPAAGFSLSELDDAGLDLDLAESLGLPVDAGRIGAYGPNVTTLRDFVRSSRQPL